jgi:hypothetical protein
VASPAARAGAAPEPRGRGPLAARLAVLAGAAVVSAAGAWLGAWWVPFLCGALAGFRWGPWSALTRSAVPFAVAGAAGGWLLPVWVLALRGQPVGATARAIAGLAGLPPYAGVTLAVVALLAALQVLAGAWLTRAFFPQDRPARGRTAAPPGAADQDE